MDLLQLWVLARRNWLVLLLTTLVGAGVGWYLSSNDRPLYTSTSSGVVVYSESGGATPRITGDRIAGYLPLVRSRAVATSVADTLAIPSLSAVGGSLSAKADNGNIFRVTAIASSSEMAASMADVALLATSKYANEMETLTMSGQPNGKTVVRIIPVEPALPGRPLSQGSRRNLVFGFAVGLLGGLGLVVFRQTMDRRVRMDTDMEALTGATVLAIVPESADMHTGTNLGSSWSQAAEAMRKLRMNLQFIKVDSPPRSIVVTSCNAGEGKSTIASHLASMLADSGKPTVLIDADLRRPVQSERFDIGEGPGLVEVLIGSASLESALAPTDRKNLFILPVGTVPPNPTEVVGSSRMQTLIDSLSKHYMLVVDAPPLLPVADGGLLAAACDGALLVVHTGKTHVDEVRMAAESLRRVNGSLLGVVMNRISRKDLSQSHYSYGNNYYGYPRKQSAPSA